MLMKAAQEAWKSREDYIGDIREECPKIYNSWRAIKFTEKAGNSEEWDNFTHEEMFILGKTIRQIKNNRIKNLE